VEPQLAEDDTDSSAASQTAFWNRTCTIPNLVLMASPAIRTEFTFGFITYMNPMRIALFRGGTVGTQALLVELLLSAFFAVACIRARAGSSSTWGLTPQKLFVLTDRLERLRRSRWQWFSMVLLLVMLRLQRGTPMVAELTVAAQLLVFLVLPTQKKQPEAVQQR
jgi:hypothetical protein